jgi:geranylgeranyl diphosphate synthase type II
MLYSLNAGGKRLRPALLIMAYNIFDNRPIDIAHPAIPYAAAVEMIHTYSLIHDDLPGMDNDDLRRGKPTNHKVYGEATAILAGDALLTNAFEIFFDPSIGVALPYERRAHAGFFLSKAVGPSGMVGGQFADMVAQGSSSDSKTLLKYIHDNKTAAFISASLACGAILAGGTADDVNRIAKFGMDSGLAFQIVDDILDVTSTAEELGKPAGSDELLDKLTYPKLYGIENARLEADKLINSAIESLEIYGERAIILREIAKFIGLRSR